jgi:hypothetical protein
MQNQKAAKTAMCTIPVNIATPISHPSPRRRASRRDTLQARGQPPATAGHSPAPWYNAELKRTPTR